MSTRRLRAGTMTGCGWTDALALIDADGDPVIANAPTCSDPAGAPGASFGTWSSTFKPISLFRSPNPPPFPVSMRIAQRSRGRLFHGGFRRW